MTLVDAMAFHLFCSGLGVIVQTIIIGQVLIQRKTSSRQGLLHIGDMLRIHPARTRPNTHKIHRSNTVKSHFFIAL